MDKIPWKRDLLHTGLVGLVSMTIFGTATATRRYLEHQERKNPSGPSDYVTITGLHVYFHTLKTFIKTHDEKSFVKTMRHHLNRALQLFYSETKKLTGWDRNVAIRDRTSEVLKIHDVIQYLLKKRLGEQPIPQLDEALKSIQQAGADLLHNLDTIGQSSLTVSG